MYFKDVRKNAVSLGPRLFQMNPKARLNFMTISGIPKPCKRFSKRIPLNAKFVAHLPDCEACKAVVIFRERVSKAPETRVQTGELDELRAKTAIQISPGAPLLT